MMDREEKNLGSILLFIVIILAIIFGGYYVMNHSGKGQNENKEYQSNQESKNIKKEQDKDYIYYTDENILSDKLQLIYKNIHININSKDAEKTESDLNKKMNEIKGNVEKYNDSITDVPKDLIIDDIYKAEMVDYEFHENNKYLSLTVNNYVYSASDAYLGNGVTNSIINYYVFDIETGKLLENHDILTKEKKTDQEIRSKIREYLNSVEDVDIDTTLAGDYQLGISSSGKILISIIVKSYNIDYNIEIEMD